MLAVVSRHLMDLDEGRPPRRQTELATATIKDIVVPPRRTRSRGSCRAVTGSARRAELANRPDAWQ
jgi:hypothetical protein